MLFQQTPFVSLNSEVPGDLRLLLPLQGSFYPLLLTTILFLASSRPASAEELEIDGNSEDSSDLESEEIEVRAPRRSMEKDDVEGGTSEKIQLNNLENRNRPLTEILEKEASIRVQRYGGAGAYSTLSIRGSNANQVNVYINGIPLNNAVTGEINLADLDTSSMQSMEIHRGTATMLSNPTIGGAVNFKTSDRSCVDRLYMRGGSYRTFGAGFFFSHSGNFDSGSYCDVKKQNSDDLARSRPEDNPADKDQVQSADYPGDSGQQPSAKRPFLIKPSSFLKAWRLLVFYWRRRRNLRPEFYLSQ